MFNVTGQIGSDWRTAAIYQEEEYIVFDIQLHEFLTLVDDKLIDLLIETRSDLLIMYIK